jgi:hypothetical protein
MMMIGPHRICAPWLDLLGFAHDKFIQCSFKVLSMASMAAQDVARNDSL